MHSEAAHRLSVHIPTAHTLKKSGFDLVDTKRYNRLFLLNMFERDVELIEYTVRFVYINTRLRAC